MFFFLTYLTIYFLSVRKVPLLWFVWSTRLLQLNVENTHMKVLLNVACLRATVCHEYFAKMAAVCLRRTKTANKMLQRALGAAAFQSGLHLLGVRGAVGAAEDHLPPPALGDSTANTRGCCCLAGSGAVHAGNLTGRCARSQRLVSLQLLPDHLALTRQLWTWTEDKR